VYGAEILIWGDALKKSFEATSALIPLIERGLKSKNLLFEIFSKMTLLGVIYAGNTLAMCYLCVKTRSIF
jgi:ABC-type enterochelin transport system substrate-binding protein